MVILTKEKQIISMKEMTREEYLRFFQQHNEIVIEGKKVKLVDWGKLSLFEPEDFKLEKTSVWSFENRGKWATHRGDYRGNWAPEIPRNLILRYSAPGDLVLDQMVGSGTTIVECKLLGRNGIGVDINPDAIMVAWNRVDFAYADNTSVQRLYVGDARNLSTLSDDSVDLIATHPPYANIIPFSKQKRIEADLSQVHSVDEFIAEMKQVAKESYRVLKPGRHCGILIGDTHKHAHYVPIAFRVLEAFQDVGFILREDVIKRQWHTETMRGRWRESYNHSFLLIFHEHLFIFRKPNLGEGIGKFKYSAKWLRTPTYKTIQERKAIKMEKQPLLRGIPNEKILEARHLQDGQWLFKISNRKGPGDFRVAAFDPKTNRRITPTYAHFAIDLYGKLCSNRQSTQRLLGAIENLYNGEKAVVVLKQLSDTSSLSALSNLPGYSLEYTLHAIELIFEQENVTWVRDFINKGRARPEIRKSLIKQGLLTEEEAQSKGCALAIHLLREVVKRGVHPVTAMKAVGLRI